MPGAWRPPPREALTFTDALRVHNILSRRPHALPPTGEQAFRHACLDLAQMVVQGYAPVILVHGEGEFGTGLGITKSTACMQMAELTQEIVSEQLGLGLPRWLDENLTLDLQVPDPRDWRNVAYTADDVSRYRSYARAHRGRPYFLLFDEPTLAMLSNEANKERGVYLYQELQACRNDNVTILLAMANWRKLAGGILDQVPYSLSLPAKLKGRWLKRKVHATGADFEKRREQLNHYPVKVCRYHPGGPWEKVEFRYLPLELFNVYEAQKNRRRDAALHDKRVQIEGKDKKELHEGEHQEALGNEISIAMHLLDWRGEQHCDLCADMAAALPLKKKGKAPGWREIQARHHIAARAMQIANERLRRAQIARAGGPAAPPPPTEQGGRTKDEVERT